MKNAVLIVCLGLALLSNILDARADDVWVPPKGSLHTTFSITASQWDQFLQNGTSSIELPGDITQYEISTNIEYVPIENLSVDLLFPIVISQRKFVFLQTDTTGQITGVTTGPNGEVRDVNTNSGIGDVVFGSKYIFWEKGISLGARAWLKVPGSYDVGYVVNAPGDGQVDFGTALLAGGSFPQIRMYIRGSLGYVFRAAEPQNQLEVMLEPGVSVTDQINLRLIYQHTEQFGGDDILVYNLTTYYPAVEKNSDRLSFGISYKASDTISFFTNYAQTVAGKNSANMKGFTFGMDVNF